MPRTAEKRLPPLGTDTVPAGTRSLALLVDDRDTPGATFVYWLVRNLALETRVIAEGSLPAGAVQG